MVQRRGIRFWDASSEVKLLIQKKVVISVNLCLIVSLNFFFVVAIMKALSMNWNISEDFFFVNSEQKCTLLKEYVCYEEWFYIFSSFIITLVILPWITPRVKPTCCHSTPKHSLKAAALTVTVCYYRYFWCIIFWQDRNYHLTSNTGAWWLLHSNYYYLFFVFFFGKREKKNARRSKYFSI